MYRRDKKGNKQMLDKILSFLKEYITNIDEAIKGLGKYKTASGGLIAIIHQKILTKEELRKELSIYTRRIISISEFEGLLNYNEVEYQRILYEG